MYDMPPIKSNLLGAHQWPAWGFFYFLILYFFAYKNFYDFNFLITLVT